MNRLSMRSLAVTACCFLAPLACHADFDFGSDSANAADRTTDGGDLKQIIDGLNTALENAAATEAPKGDDVLSDIGTPEYGGDKDKAPADHAGRRRSVIDPAISIGGLPSIGLPSAGSRNPNSGGMGMPSAGGSGLPGGMSGGMPGAAGDPGMPTGNSGSQRVSDLDRALDKSLDGFDGIIMDEQQQARAEQQAAGAADGADSVPGEQQISMAGAGGDGDSQGNAQAGAAGAQPPMPSARSKSEGRSGSPGAPNANGAQQTAAETGGDANDERVAAAEIPDDIQPADNNDIVGRQLQEAALKESDPVLRDKIWDEFRKHQAQR